MKIILVVLFAAGYLGIAFATYGYMRVFHPAKAEYALMGGTFWPVIWAGTAVYLSVEKAGDLSVSLMQSIKDPPKCVLSDTMPPAYSPQIGTTTSVTALPVFPPTCWSSSSISLTQIPCPSDK